MRTFIPRFESQRKQPAGFGSDPATEQNSPLEVEGVENDLIRVVTAKLTGI
jgi:hypothetical protein